ncbi:TolC family outer membrane protein [Ottowia testudinis]|uniref:TolC family outer membrane protein n=2 Tax=Ottowia testudinis TaxID=2816950 RepID=A0A975CNB0_9BURK|nr:TolC family outer membrane protein [Ottowia testudinis]QTD46648.1 TolC family outer membrane protein [Ottowia testudinis]
MTMPTRRPLAHLAAVLALAAAPVQAQSLLQLYEAAHGYDAPYQSALANAQATQARADQARAGLLPQVGLQMGAQRNWAETSVAANTGSRAFNVLNGSIVGSQPLYRPANRISWDQGKRAAEAARVQLSGTEQDLIVRLSQAYFDVLAAEDSLNVVRALKAAVTEQLESAKRNFEVGNATITDSREAQARFDLATAQEIAAENDRRVKRLALDQLVGLAGVQPRPLAQPIVLPQPQPADVSTWVEWATHQHPAVVQSRMALDIARLETAKAKTGHLPTVDLQASVGQNRYPDGNPSVSAAPNARYRSTNAGIGVVLNWPLFAGFAVENRVRETLSLEDKARADLDNIQRTVAQATRAAFFGVQSGHGQVAALEAAERSSLTALEANQLGYQVGVRINIDVLNAQNQLYQTRRDLARARYDVLLGLLRLKQASGTLTPADLQPINQMLLAEGVSAPAVASPRPPADTPAAPSAAPASAPRSAASGKPTPSSRRPGRADRR